MSEDREHQRDFGDDAEVVREQEREARDAPEERRPEERGEANTASEAADVQP